MLTELPCVFAYTKLDEDDGWMIMGGFTTVEPVVGFEVEEGPLFLCLNREWLCDEVRISSMDSFLGKPTRPIEPPCESISG